MEEKIKFKKTNLLNYDAIKAPGKYSLEVANNVSEKNLFTDENGSRYIVNLKAVAADKLAQVLETFKDSDEVEFEQTNGLFLTGSIWKRDGEQPNLPMKGEKVECAISTVTSRDGEEVLRVINMRVNGAIKASKISFEAVKTEQGALAHQ